MSNKIAKHLIKKNKKCFGLKSFSLAAIAGLTLFGAHANAEGSVSPAAADIITAGDTQTLGEQSAYTYSDTDTGFKIIQYSIEKQTGKILDETVKYIDINKKSYENGTITYTWDSNNKLTVSLSGNSAKGYIEDNNYYGDYIGNVGETSSNNRAGAINVEAATVGNITGDFINNTNSPGYVTGGGNTKYSQGGAIYSRHGDIGDITANFIGNKTASGYAEGSAINIANGSAGDITGDFIGNYNNTDSESFAALRFYSTVAKNVTGDFIGNTTISSRKEAAGALMIGYTKIDGDITGNFINNYTKGGFVNGGAIYQYSNGSTASSVKDISGDFISNKIYGVNSHGHGGAIKNSVSSASYSSTIQSIKGIFIDNGIEAATEAYGGGIMNMNGGAKINSIQGIFSNNYAHTPSGKAYGGAIYNTGVIGEITDSVFNGNYAKSENGEAYGGALYISGANAIVGDITADFTDNYVSAKPPVKEGYTTTYFAKGGAIYIGEGATVGNITGTFKNNSAQQGGAIYIEKAQVGTISGTFENHTGNIINAQYIGKLTIGDDTTFKSNINLGDSDKRLIDTLTNEVAIGDNANMSNNLNASSSGLIYSSNVNKFTIGDDLIYTNNEGRSSIYVHGHSNDSDNEFTIGDNANISNNNNTYSNGLIYAEDLNKFTIGDNLTYTSNDGNSSIYTIFKSSNTNNEFLLGNNANISNNNNTYNWGGLIYASDSVNKFAIGDNLTYTDNTGNSSIYAVFNYQSPNNKFLLGNNANISNNTNTNYGGLLYAYNVNKFTIGDNLTYTDNTGNSSIYTVFNYSDTNNEFLLGSNANISNNDNAYYGGLLSAYNINRFTIGDNLTYTNNTGKSSIYTEFRSSNPDNEFLLGDNAKFVNNVVSNGSGTIYMSGDNNLIANFGKNTLFEGNEANGNLGGAIFFGGKELTFADNAQFINNTANPYPNGGTQSQGGAIVMYNSNGNSVLNLLNAKFIGNTVTGNSNDSRGGAIYGNGTKEINITSDNGQTLFKDNKDIVGENDIYLHVYPNKPTTVNLKSVNNGEIEFNGTIEGDNQFNLNVLGDDSSKVTLNNKIINGITTLEDTNLYLGVTDKEGGVSDVLAHEGTTMTAKTGTIHLEDNSITD